MAPLPTLLLKPKILELFLIILFCTSSQLTNFLGLIFKNIPHFCLSLFISVSISSMPSPSPACHCAVSLIYFPDPPNYYPPTQRAFFYCFQHGRLKPQGLCICCFFLPRAFLALYNSLNVIFSERLSLTILFKVVPSLVPVLSPYIYSLHYIKLLCFFVCYLLECKLYEKKRILPILDLL